MGTKEKTTGLRLARNVKQLREDRKLTIRDLAGKMTEDLGRKILPSGIVKIEQGERGVDADDLVALALALGVTPNRLLLTGGVPDESVALTPTQQASAVSAWWWATGQQRLPGAFAVSDQQFGAENRPHDPPGTTTVSDLRKMAAEGRLETLHKGFREARAAGLGVGEIAELLELWELDDADLLPVEEDRRGQR
jgi:transcriptional regulator with XRE-family HTH domain